MAVSLLIISEILTPSRAAHANSVWPSSSQKGRRAAGRAARIAQLSVSRVQVASPRRSPTSCSRGSLT